MRRPEKFSSLAIYYAGIAILIVAAMWPICTNSYFWWDDYSFLLNAKSGLSGIAEPHLEHFLPVFRFALFILYKLFGMNWFLYGCTLLGIHCINVCLLFRLIDKDIKQPSLSCALSLLFGLNQIAYLSTHWMCLISLQLSSTFFLLSALMIHRPLLSNLLILISFASFGATPLLAPAYIAYCIYKKVKIRFICISLLSFCCYAWVASRAGSSGEIPIRSMLSLPSLLEAIFESVKAAWLLSGVGYTYLPLILVVAAGFTFNHVRVRPTVSAGPLILSGLALLLLIFAIPVVAHIVRGSVSWRQLYFSALGLVWYLSVLTHSNLRFSEMTYRIYSVALWVSTVIISWHSFNVSTAILEDHYRKLFIPARSYVEDFAKLVSSAEDRNTDYLDVSLPEAVNPHLKMSDLVALVSPSRPITFAAIDSSTQFPVRWDKGSEIMRHRRKLILRYWMHYYVNDQKFADFAISQYELQNVTLGEPVHDQREKGQVDYESIDAKYSYDGQGYITENALSVLFSEQPFSVLFREVAFDYSVGDEILMFALIKSEDNGAAKIRLIGKDNKGSMTAVAQSISYSGSGKWELLSVAVVIPPRTTSLAYDIIKANTVETETKVNVDHIRFFKN